MKQTRHRFRLFLGRTIAPPRFLAFLVLLPVASYLHQRLIEGAEWTASLAIGFDVAAGIFLVSLLPLLRSGGTDADSIRCRADANNANRIVVLVVSSLLTLVVMAAIAGELPGARHGDWTAMAGLVGTLVLIWLFANSVYALHYAHDYYSARPEDGGDSGGLDFPETPQPGYVDFAYFAYTLGMTFQTSDVAITSRRIRSVALLHSFAAFIFNIGVIAFTINVLGGSS